MFVSVLVFQVEFDRVETDDYQSGTTFLACGRVALFYFGIYVNFFAAFGTNGCWHLLWISRNLKLGGLSFTPKSREIGLTFNLT